MLFCSHPRTNNKIAEFAVATDSMTGVILLSEDMSLVYCFPMSANLTAESHKIPWRVAETWRDLSIKCYIGICVRKPSNGFQFIQFYCFIHKDAEKQGFPIVFSVPQAAFPLQISRAGGSTPTKTHIHLNNHCYVVCLRIRCRWLGQSRCLTVSDPGRCCRSVDPYQNWLDRKVAIDIRMLFCYFVILLFWSIKITK